MDLVTLVTACALGVDPKLMHALVWHQSGGEPWAVSGTRESEPRPYRSLREALAEARSASTGRGSVRIGLAGLPADPLQVDEAMLLPCRNIQLASRQIATLIARCEEQAYAEPTACALAAYSGSWNEPNVKFAREVMASISNGDAPNFDMPKNTKLEFLDVASETSPQPENAASPRFAIASDERQRGWSSALFPAREGQWVQTSIGAVSDNPAASKLQADRARAPHTLETRAPESSLFVPRSSAQRPQ